MTRCKDLPILFSAPMILAILADRKTQTRRLNLRWLRAVKGHRLWVRETWCVSFASDDGSTNGYCYRATHDGPAPIRWCPSIFMPRWASRITLEVISVREQRLQDISEQDAIAEGMPPSSDKWPISAYARYSGLWDSINGVGSWFSNPTVAAVEFRRVET